MTLKEIDLNILKEFNRLNGDETTTWTLMKKFYPVGKERENEIIKRRIKRMSEKGLFLVHGNPRTFSMIKDYVVFKKIKFPDKFANGICLKVNDKWEQYEL